jgi:hypothetical protein
MSTMATPTAVNALAAPTPVASVPVPVDLNNGSVASEPEEAESSDMDPSESADADVASPEETDAEGAAPDTEDSGGDIASPDYEDGDAAEGEGADYEGQDGAAQVANADPQSAADSSQNQEQDYEPQDASIASGRHHGRRGRRIRYKKKKDEERWRRGIVRNRIRSLRATGQKKAYGKTYFHKKTEYP